MKANELMIGDWVRIVDDDTDQSFETRITGVSGLGNIYAPLPGGEHAYPFSEDCVEPIPITPEILEKNGFVRVERGEICTCYRWREKSDKIYGRLVDIHLYKEPIQGVFTLIEIETCSNKGDGLNRFHSCDTDYVHELQHALRLCGIEKEIVL